MSEIYPSFCFSQEDPLFGNVSPHNNKSNFLAEQDTSYRSTTPVSPATTLSQKGDGRGEDVDTLPSDDDTVTVSKTNKVEQRMKPEMRIGMQHNV